MSYSSRRPVAVTAVLLLIATAAALAYNIVIDKSARLNGNHYAVLLTNGQLYFGRVDNQEGSRTILRDVFYLTRTGTGDQTRNILVRRGSEWHEPTEMLINSQQILLMEPVGSASKVAKLIRETNGK